MCLFGCTNWNERCFFKYMYLLILALFLKERFIFKIYGGAKKQPWHAPRGYFCSAQQNGTYKSQMKRGLLRHVFTVTSLKMLVMEQPLLRFSPCYSKNRTQNPLTYLTFICLPKVRCSTRGARRNSQRRICGGKPPSPIHCAEKG